MSTVYAGRTLSQFDDAITAWHLIFMLVEFLLSLRPRYFLEVGPEWTS